MKWKLEDAKVGAVYRARVDLSEDVVDSLTKLGLIDSKLLLVEIFYLPAMSYRVTVLNLETAKKIRSLALERFLDNFEVIE